MIFRCYYTLVLYTPASCCQHSIVCLLYFIEILFSFDHLFICYLLDNKTFVSPASPSPEETKRCDTQTVKSERDSPAPGSYEDLDKKAQVTKHKGRPKPLPGSKPEIKCEQCGKIFGSSSALAKHKLTHSDERRYVCPICSKGFKRQDHL